jgi:hypothetical protein
MISPCQQLIIKTKDNQIDMDSALWRRVFVLPAGDYFRSLVGRTDDTSLIPIYSSSPKHGVPERESRTPQRITKLRAVTAEL